MVTKGRFRIAHCGIKGVDAVTADTPHSFGRHIHDQFGIGVMLHGAQKSMSGRGMVEAKAGDVITVNPGEVHDGSSLDGNGRSWRMLYFEPAILNDPILALTEGDSDSTELAYPVMRNATTARHFLTLFDAITDPHGGQSEIESQESLLLLLARLVEHRYRKHSEAPKAIEQARARIDDDPAAPLSLGELAAIGGVSQFQLLRGFSKMTGLTPHAYLIQRRLQIARKMIAGGTTLADAAQASGFADQSHMTRLFVRTYGMSPGIYAAALN